MTKFRYHKERFKDPVLILRIVFLYSYLGQTRSRPGENYAHLIFATVGTFAIRIVQSDLKVF